MAPRPWAGALAIALALVACQGAPLASKGAKGGARVSPPVAPGASGPASGGRSPTPGASSPTSGPSSPTSGSSSPSGPVGPVVGRLLWPRALALAGAQLLAQPEARIISDQGSGLLSNNGGGLIANNGAGILSDQGALALAPQAWRLTSRRLQAAGLAEASASAGAALFAVDAQGALIPGQGLAKTDAQGRFELPGLPLGQSVVVAAAFRMPNGQQGVVRALAKVGAGQEVQLSVASTFATLAAYEQVRSFGDFTPERFEALRTSFAGQLTEQDPLRLLDEVALRNRIRFLEAQVAELKAQVAALQAEVARLSQPSPPPPSPRPLPSTPSYVVRTLVGGEEEGAADGSATEARFSGLAALDWSASEACLYGVDFGNQSVRRIDPTTGAVRTIAGGGGPGHANGVGPAARFQDPVDLAVRPDGSMLVADWNNHLIRLVQPSGEVSDLAGQPGQPGRANGALAQARFAFPHGVAVGPGGTVWIADQENQQLRRLDPDGQVQLVAGNGLPGSRDGAASAATFDNPLDVVVNPQGVAYLLDRTIGLVRRVQAGQVGTLAGGSQRAEALEGFGAGVNLAYPEALAFLPDGNLVVTDTKHGRVVKVFVDTGAVVTLAGGAGAGGVDGPGLQATFEEPYGVAVAPDGRIFVTEYTRIRVLTPQP